MFIKVITAIIMYIIITVSNTIIFSNSSFWVLYMYGIFMCLCVCVCALIGIIQLFVILIYYFNTLINY